MTQISSTNEPQPGDIITRGKDMVSFTRRNDRGATVTDELVKGSQWKVTAVLQRV